MSDKVYDWRAKGKKGLYVVFWTTWNSDDTPYQNAAIYSSFHHMLRSVAQTAHIPQFIHDATGELIAYAQHGEVVACLD